MIVDLPLPLVSIRPQRYPPAELHRDVGEQRLGPELHGDAGGDDHWISRNKKSRPLPALYESHCEGATKTASA
jgi:hypothetical protein